MWDIIVGNYVDLLNLSYSKGHNKCIVQKQKKIYLGIQDVLSYMIIHIL
jgi:hypothetical protein